MWPPAAALLTPLQHRATEPQTLQSWDYYPSLRCILTRLMAAGRQRVTSLNATIQVPHIWEITDRLWYWLTVAFLHAVTLSFQLRASVKVTWLGIFPTGSHYRYKSTFKPFCVNGKLQCLMQMQKLKLFSKISDLGWLDSFSALCTGCFLIYTCIAWFHFNLEIYRLCGGCWFSSQKWELCHFLLSGEFCAPICFFFCIKLWWKCLAKLKNA